jgi:hypothetical protein
MRGRNESNGRVSRVIYNRGLAAFAFEFEPHPFLSISTPWSGEKPGSNTKAVAAPAAEHIKSAPNGAKK